MGYDPRTGQAPPLLIASGGCTVVPPRCADRAGRWGPRNMLALLLALLLLILSACVGGESPPPVGAADEERIRAALADRSFRQFDPGLDASPRRGVILDFFGPISIWAQYAEGGHAVNEWEIVADDYRIEATADGSEITIRLIDPGSRQQFPVACEDCIDTGGVSISIRDLFDAERIAFRLNDPNGVLPPPFPVFDSWTRFREDEIVD